MSGTPGSHKHGRGIAALQRWKHALAMRSKRWRWLRHKTAVPTQPSPESLECRASKDGCPPEIDLSIDLADSIEPRHPTSAADELLTMKTSTHGSLKAIKRQAQGKPPHTIKVWSLQDLKRYGPDVPPVAYLPEELGWDE
jgi:hypothetical protein